MLNSVRRVTTTLCRFGFVGKSQTGKSNKVSGQWPPSPRQVSGHLSEVQVKSPKLPVLNNRHDCCGFSAVIFSEKCWRMLPGHNIGES